MIKQNMILKGLLNEAGEGVALPFTNLFGYVDQLLRDRNGFVVTLLEEVRHHGLHYLGLLT